MGSPKRPARSSTSSQSGAKVAEFVRFASELKVEDGQPLTIQPFQRLVLADYFGGARETALIIPKKNGKTTLLAALALYHLVVTPNAECIIVAASREQAEIVLRQARMFVRQSEALQRLMTIQQRSVISRLDEGRIRVLASDADTADGSIPTLAIVDELHRHKSAELYAVLRDGLGPRSGQLITISTAGSRMDSPLGQLRQKAHSLPNFTRKGTHNHVRSPDGMFAFHEWCLVSEDDVGKISIVKKANPAPWQTLAKLRERQDSPSMTPWEWLRFACGIWTEGEEPWITPQAWDSLAGEVSFAEGETVWMGVDIGLSRSSALVVVAIREDKVFAEAHILAADRVSVEAMERLASELAERYKVRALLYDPYAFQRSAELLERAGLTVLEFPQSAERMAKASATLYELIESKRLVHTGAPDFRAHVLAGVTKETERGWRLQRDPARHPINALIALAIAAHHATETNVPQVPLFAYV